jgi:peptidoglycan L-alanyl-D-glutamate endopeptidase CwlK
LAKFSRSSREKLETCGYDLQVLFRRVIEIIDCTVLCGRRGEEEQNQAFEAGKSRCKWPESKHNAEAPVLSPAIDVAPYYVEKPHIRWDKKSLWRWYFFGGIVLGIADTLQISIRWGGDWDRDTYVRDQKFNDLPHFELF